MSAESSQLQKLEIMLQDIEAKPCDPSLQLLKDVTDQFSDGRQLGRGGFGVVYKGVLGNGKIIAVKKFVFMPGVIDRQFENEVYHLMVLKHQNIVRFLGYCFETRQVCMEHNGKLCLVEMQERLLCLEYMPNGSLKEHISDESRGLDWHERYKIIKGICCGLHYLHEEKGILHFDLKPANILLTNEMVPKITDFGTSILFGTEKSRTYTESVEGTVGYMAREYLHKGIITNKSDIFSLGVIIIEMITGHRDYPESAGTSVHDFVDDVLDKWRNRLEYLRYSSLEKDCQQIKSCVEIGLRCVQIDARQRPTAKEIVESLNRWDTMIVHVVNEESSPADQVLQNWVNASQPGIPHTVLQADQTVLNAESPRQNVPAENVPSNNVSVKEPPPDVYPSNGFRTCAGCKNPICHGRFLSCMDAYWHPQCFRCFACNKPISEYEFSMHEDQPYHKSCYKEFFHPKCDVCNHFIPTNRNGLIEYRSHPFWMQKYCPAHEDDGTPRCCSCEQMEPTEADYKALGDGRKLCLECLGSAVMDIPQCQQLYTDIQEFFEGLNMQVEQQVPLLLVERHALNEAMIAEKNGHRLPETRGLFLSEKQTIFRRLFIKVSRRSEVTGIHILYGLPRLLTGSILAHMMMLAYLHLNGYRNLSPEVHAGIGLVLSYMWLEYDIYGVPCGNIASSSAEASSSTPTTSKKGAKTEFEKKFGAFLMRQIETDSSAYGDGFRAGNQAVERYGLRSTLEHIKRTGSFPSLK